MRGAEKGREDAGIGANTQFGQSRLNLFAM